LLSVRWWIVLIAAGCHAYDPIEEVPHRHREVADTAAAITLILAENPAPRVFAIGEYHARRATADRTSALARFSREVVGLLEPRAHHIVVESWDSSTCLDDHNAFAASIDRPKGVQMELLHLRRASRQFGIVPHDIPMTCLEQDSLLHGRIDYVLLLEVITQKLHEEALALAEADPDHAVIVYGGALHNDLYPRWPLEELSYALLLQRELGPGSVLEIDLVAPEIVAPLAMVRDEPWFPLLGRAAPGRAIVWRRAPSSYVVILPAESDAVAKVAQVM
jgi:hypothetical protein